MRPRHIIQVGDVRAANVSIIQTRTPTIGTSFNNSLRECFVKFRAIIRIQLLPLHGESDRPCAPVLSFWSVVVAAYLSAGGVINFLMQIQQMRV